MKTIEAIKRAQNSATILAQHIRDARKAIGFKQSVNIAAIQWLLGDALEDAAKVERKLKGLTA